MSVSWLCAQVLRWWTGYTVMYVSVVDAVECVMAVCTGSEMVDWLYSHVEGFVDRRDARRYACNLLKAGFIHHTVNKLTFSEQCYYVFGNNLLKGLNHEDVYFCLSLLKILIIRVSFISFHSYLDD